MPLGHGWIVPSSLGWNRRPFWIINRQCHRGVSLVPSWCVMLSAIADSQSVLWTHACQRVLYYCRRVYAPQVLAPGPQDRAVSSTGSFVLRIIRICNFLGNGFTSGYMENESNSIDALTLQRLCSHMCGTTTLDGVSFAIPDPQSVRVSVTVRSLSHTVVDVVVVVVTGCDGWLGCSSIVVDVVVVVVTGCGCWLGCSSNVVAVVYYCCIFVALSLRCCCVIVLLLLIIVIVVVIIGIIITTTSSNIVIVVNVSIGPLSLLGRRYGNTTLGSWLLSVTVSLRITGELTK